MDRFAHNQYLKGLVAADQKRRDDEAVLEAKIRSLSEGSDEDSEELRQLKNEQKLRKWMTAFESVQPKNPVFVQEMIRFINDFGMDSLISDEQQQVDEAAPERESIFKNIYEKWERLDEEREAKKLAKDSKEAKSKRKKKARGSSKQPTLRSPNTRYSLRSLAPPKPSTPELSEESDGSGSNDSDWEERQLLNDGNDDDGELLEEFID